jgi:SAM-dependent methyltransferase
VIDSKSPDPLTPHRRIRGHPWCPLCGGASTVSYHEDAGREYRLCTLCMLIFVPPAMLPTPLEEVLRYVEHENSRDDPRYEQFLRRLADPLSARLPCGARGLDFGSGPTPVLAELLTADGFPTASYDPFFAPDESLLDGVYDFIACSETVEHLHHPGEVFDRFSRILKPGGTVGVMTRFYGHEAPFERWWYRRDPTHVSFYREETMRWIGQRHGWRVEFPVANVAIFAAQDSLSTAAGATSASPAATR